MAFTTVATGDTIQASHIQELQNEITAGTIPLAVTGVNDSTAYAADFQNLDATNGYTLRARDDAGGVIATLTRALITFGKKVVISLASGTVAAATRALEVTDTWNNASTTFHGIYVSVTSTLRGTSSRLIQLYDDAASRFSIETNGAAHINTVTETGGGTDALIIQHTWNDAAVAFRGIAVLITNTLSAATSRLLDLQVGGVSEFTVGRDGLLTTESVPTVALVDLSVTTAKIDNLGVTTGKIAANAVDKTKAGDGVPQVVGRQGGSASVWATVGTTDYTPTAVVVQAGAVEWTGGAAANGTKSITFPVAFSAAPVVIATATLNLINVAISAISGSSTTFAWQSVDASTHTFVDINWIAIGPE